MRRSIYCLALLVALVLFCNCSKASSRIPSMPAETVQFYDSLDRECGNLMFEFRLCHDSVLLDSVISIIETNKCDTFSFVFSGMKLKVLTLKKDYYTGLAYIETSNQRIGKVDPSLFRDAPNHFCDVMHIKAMIAQHEGDMKRRNQYIHEILDTLRAQVPICVEDSVLRLNSVSKLMQYEKCFYIYRSYYYRIILYGVDKVRQEFLEKYPDFDDPDELIEDYSSEFMIFDWL